MHFLNTHHYILSTAVPVEVGYVIAVIVTLSGAVGVLFKMYDSVRKEERERLIISYDNQIKTLLESHDKQLTEKNNEIAEFKLIVKEYQSRENLMTDKVIEVLESTNSIARDNLQKMQNG